LIAVLIRFLLDAVGLLCALAVLPSKALVALAMRFVAATRPSSAFPSSPPTPSSWRWRWWTEALLWLPRWLAVDAALLCYLLHLGAAAAALVVSSSASGHAAVGVVAALATLAAFTFGNSFARRNPSFAGWFPRGPLFGTGGILPAFAEVQGELLAFVSLLFAALSLVRLPSLAAYVCARNAGRRPGLRLNSFAQQARAEACCAMLDTVRFAARALTPPWRWPMQSREAARVWNAAGELASSLHPRHGVVLRAATRAALRQLATGILEAPLYASLLVVSPFTPWRIEPTVSRLLAAEDADVCRAVVVRQLLLALADIGSMVAGACVLCTWRGPELLRQLALVHDARQRRKIVWNAVGNLLADLRDLPHILMALFVVLTLWRAFPLWSALQASSSRQQSKEIIRRQFWLCLLDIPATLLACIIFLTLWRAPNLVRRLRREPFIPRPASPAPLVQRADERDCPPPPPLIKPSTWHRVVFSEFTQLLIDTPFPLIAVFTLWRLPFLLRAVVRQCNTAAERRNKVLVYIWLMLKDIPTALMALCVLLTGLRVPTIVARFRSFEEGDDEHAIVLSVFLDLLGDIPYVLLLLFVAAVAPWRIFDLVCDLVTTKTASQRRALATEYAWTAFGDYGVALVVALALVTLLRLPTLIYHLFHVPPAEKPSNPEERIPLTKRRLTRTLHRAASLTASGMVLDTWVLFMIAFTAIGIFHLVPMLWSVCAILRLYLKRGVGDGSESPMTLWDYNSGMRQRCYYCENEGCPLTLTLFEPAISGHFFSSIRDLPHVLLLPVKACAPPLLPVHWYIGWRFCSAAQHAHKPHYRYTVSFITRWVIPQHELASRETDFWSSHVFALRTGCSLLLVFANELSVVLLSINACFLFVCTLCSPLWRDRASVLSARAQATLRAVVFFSVCISAPFFFAANAFLWLVPCWIAHYWLLQPLYTTALVFVLSTLVMASLWHLTYLLAERAFEWFSPTAAYTWVFNEFIGDTLWRWYMSLLDRATTFCYPLRNLRYLLIGEVLLSGVVVLWAGWPVLFAWFVLPRRFPARRLWLFISLQLSCLLMHRAYHLVQRRWRWLSRGGSWEVRPLIALESLVPVFPAESRLGFGLEFRGLKHPALHVQQARMVLRGKDFWAALSVAMGPFWVTVLRQAFQPLQLCPVFLDAEPFSEGVRNVCARFTFGTESQPKLLRISRRVLRRYLEVAVAAGKDPVVDVVIDYGRRSWGLWVISGRLVAFRLKLGALLEALWADHPVNLLQTGGAWVVS